ncbi:hypothetical protein IMPERIA89_210027 [Imperialibacter sp. 89]|nr:hypothetical protein IMPERIA89_210027 [Imperialibacter sp. 89]
MSEVKSRLVSLSGFSFYLPLVAQQQGSKVGKKISFSQKNRQPEAHQILYATRNGTYERRLKKGTNFPKAVQKR